jgi:hypothetical protein
VTLSENEDRSISIGEFCLLEGFSLGYFYKLKKLGLAPKILHPPGTQIFRITAQARRDWHSRMEKEGQTKAAKQEAQRRTELGRRAGKAAAASPNFNRRKAG